MRIAVVCSDTGIRIPDTKGASLHVSAIATALAEVGHDVLLVGVAGHGCPPAGIAAVLVRHPGWSKGIRRELRKLNTVEAIVKAAHQPLTRFAPDVIYERLALFGTAGQRLAGMVDARHVVEVNALIAEEESQWRGLRLGALARRRERAVLEGASLRVAVSEELAAAIDRVVPDAPTAVLPNGLDGKLFAQLPGRDEARTFLRLPGEVPLIGFAGSLRPWHGLEVAVDALVDVPEAILVVAGEGEVRARIEARARDLGLGERVRWIGQLPHQLIPGFLSAVDVALLPYPALVDFAFSPLKLFEYLAAGVPVVASDIGQVRALLHNGEFGLLVPPGEPSALAAGIRQVLADPERARRGAAAARATALAEHTWRRRAETLTAVLQEVRGHALAG